MRKLSLLLVLLVVVVFASTFASGAAGAASKTKTGAHAKDPTKIDVNALYREFAAKQNWTVVPQTVPTKQPPLTCEVCKFFVGVFKGLIETNATETELEYFFAQICIFLNIYPDLVCNGVASEFGPEVIEVLLSRFISAEEICVHFLFCPASALTKAKGEAEEKDKDVIHVPPPLAKSVLQQRKANEQKWKAMFQEKLEWGSPSLLRSIPSAGVGSFLQLTDIHVDPEYQVGTNVDCDIPLCCREVYGEGTAREWGEYNCDIPESLFTQMLATINSSMSLELDFIIWTGDNPPHDIWNENQQMQIERTKRVVDIIKESFPTVPVFPALGNHESFPVDQFPSPPRNEWLMKPLASFFSTWLDKDALATFVKGGYYTTLVKPGLRLVSLNTQYCDIMNFWLIANFTDPADQLSWLQGVLSNAYAQKEQVYIIGHIPFGDSTCLYGYAAKVEVLVRKYSSIIAGQFYGHTHKDSFGLYYDKKGGSPINVAYTAPSVTTYTKINPSFRVFSYDRSSSEVLDYTQYYTDLHQTYENGGSPKWQKSYSAKEYFRLSSMSPSEWQNLALRLNSSDADFQQWYNVHYTRYNGLHPCSTEECKRGYVCGFHAATFKEALECSGDEYNIDNLWEWIMNHLC
ncbi:Sphingomyelin phosphodiesterase [Balamuthia mandrillaris]